MAKLPENKERRLQGLNQDVLAVSAPVEPASNEPVPLRTNRRQQPVSVSESSRSGTVWLALGIACVALLLAVWQWVSNMQLGREMSELKAQYYQLASTVEKAADAEPRTVREPAASGGPVDASALANLRDDLRELSSRVRTLSVAVAKAGQDDGETVKLEKRIAEVESSLKAVSGRVTTLASRPAQTAAPAPAPTTVKAAADPRVDALQTKVTKIDKDLQALYRILQGG